MFKKHFPLIISMEKHMQLIEDKCSHVIFSGCFTLGEACSPWDANAMCALLFVNCRHTVFCPLISFWGRGSLLLIQILLLLCSFLSYQTELLFTNPRIHIKDLYILSCYSNYPQIISSKCGTSFFYDVNVQQIIKLINN